MCYEHALSSIAKGAGVADFTDIIEIPPLLVPIEGDQAQGRDTRQEFDPASPYQRLRAARQDARDAERRALTAESGEQGGPPDWSAVVDAASDLIANHSKDLEAASWMTEALIRLYGLRGLGAGAALIEALATEYGEALYPSVDEDDPDEDPGELRMRPIAGIGSGSRATLLAPIRLLPLFNRQDGTAVTLADYDSAVALERLEPEQKERRIADGAVDLASLDDQARADTWSLSALLTDATDTLAAWDAMDQALGAFAGNAKPSLSEVRNLLERIAGFARRLAPEGEQPAAVEPDMGAPGAVRPSVASPATGTATGTPGAIVTREDALRRLDEVADWFRRYEPQSPLSYTLAEAVRRGRMPLPDLLAEIIEDYGTRAQILTALGIKPPPMEEG